MFRIDKDMITLKVISESISRSKKTLKQINNECEVAIFASIDTIMRILREYGQNEHIQHWEPKLIKKLFEAIKLVQETGTVEYSYLD